MEKAKLIGNKIIMVRNDEIFAMINILYLKELKI